MSDSNARWICESHVLLILFANEGRTRLEPEYLADLHELGRAFAFGGGGEIHRAEADEEVVEDCH